MYADTAALTELDWDAFDPCCIQVTRREDIQRSAIGERPRLDGLSYAGASPLIATHGTKSHPPAAPTLAHHTVYAVAD